MNFFKRFLRAWRGAGREDQEIIQQLKIMSAINNLTSAVSRLTSGVDAVAAVLAAGATTPPGVPEADVQAAADAVNAQAARLETAVTPPVAP